jgi:hypothetical protein
VKIKKLLVDVSARVTVMIMQFHRGPYLQRGRGVGSVLAAIFRNVAPTLKFLGKRALSSDVVRNVGGTLAKSAIRGGLNFAADALNGGNLKESAAANLQTAKRELSSTVKRALKQTKAITASAASAPAPRSAPLAKRARLRQQHRQPPRLQQRPRNRLSAGRSVFAEHTDDEEDNAAVTADAAASGK